MVSMDSVAKQHTRDLPPELAQAQLTDLGVQIQSMVDAWAQASRKIMDGFVAGVEQASRRMSRMTWTPEGLEVAPDDIADGDELRYWRELAPNLGGEMAAEVVRLELRD